MWQRSSPALGLQPPTPSVAQLWVALAPQFDYKTCYLLVGLWCKCGGGYHNGVNVKEIGVKRIQRPVIENAVLVPLAVLDVGA